MAHLVSELLELMTSIRFYEVEQEVRLVVGVQDEITNLTRLLLSVKLEVAGAERKRWHEQDEDAKKWLDEFEEICYDLDDVLDEWVTAILKSETKSAYGNTSKSKRKPKVHFSCFNCGQVGLRGDIASKIKEIKKKAMKFFERKRSFQKIIQNNATDSSMDQTPIYGRENEKKEITKLLLGESTDKGRPSPYVIAIEGMGGVENTSLAQLVFNDERINAEFEFKIWVPVSKDSAKIIIVEKSIFESVPNRCSSSDRAGLNDLLEETYFAVFGKKFLLVLDDVQEMDSFMLNKYLKCYFEFGLPGSKVLITTRSDRVLVRMRDYTHLFTLHEMTEDECWSLFRDSAHFGNSSREGEDMVNIRNKIVSGCKGLPFVAKALGSLLRVERSSKEQRQRVLDSAVWNQYKDKPAYPPLLLCYDDLPSKMKRCFTYCAVFSEGNKLDQEYWINLWMAQGYLRATHNEEDIIGKDYFQDLIARSFFQNVIKDGNGSTTACMMPDLVHEFAQFLTENECVNLEVSSDGVTGTVSSWEKVRHLKIEFSESRSLFPVSFDKLKKLRSLFVDHSKSDCPINIDQHDFFSQLTRLRALKLSHISSEEISAEIGKLIHLRYLDLSDNQHLKYLPEEIGELYNLQTLNLSGCCELQRLPYSLCNLINLKHLNIYHTDNLTFMPRGIGRLTSLKPLSKFVLNCSNHSNELSSPPGDVQNLNHQKYLEIRVAKMSRDMISEARKAQLKKKKQLVTLKLSFVEWRTLRIDEVEEIIQALEPPPSLEHLKIEHYGGLKIPDWIMQLPKLSKICISKFRNCYHLPPLGKLPFLEYLEISDMGVRKLDGGFLGIGNEVERKVFPKLKELRFSRMYAWEEWDDASITSEVEVMPCLFRLYIESCDKLKGLPTQLLRKNTLKVLAVDHCRFLRGQYHWKGGKDWGHISHISIIRFDGDRYSKQKQMSESVDKKAFQS